MAQTQVGIKLTLDGAQQVEQGVRRVVDSVGTIGSATRASAQQAIDATTSLKSAFLSMGGVVAAAFSVKAIVEMADSVTTLNNQLKLATGGAVAAGQAYQELFAIAQRSRVSLTELGGTFASISRAGAELGLSQQRLLGVTEAIGNAMTISGGSAASMNAALTQLGQGLASGTLRGEELNSVMEQTPRLAQALADGMGVSIGQLRELGAAGKITAEEVIKALESQSKTLASEVGDSAMTVGQALTQLQNAAVKTVGDMDEVTGASGTLASALSGVATGIQTVGQFMRENEEAITITLGALGGAAVAAGILSVTSAITGAGGMVAAIASVKAAMVGLTAFMAANPVGLAVLGIATVGGAVMAMNKGPDLSKVDVQARELEKTVKRLADAEALLDRAGGAGQGQMTAQLEARIAGLKKYRDELSAGQTQDKAITEAMRADEKQWTAEQRKATAEAEASTKRLADIKNTLFKVDTKHVQTIQELAAQRNAGNISEAEYIKLVKMAVDANASKEKSSTKLSAAAKAQAETEKEALKGLELYSNLIAETAGFQGDYAEKVSQLAEAYAKNKISLEGFTFAHEKLLAKQPAAVEATKMEAEARKVLADAVTASARAYEEAQQAMDALQADTWQMVNDTVKASDASAAAVQFELGLIGQTAEARRIAIEQRKIELDLEEKIKKVKATPFEGGEEAQLREINRLREAAAQDSATAISRIQLDEAAKSVEQYDKIFREGFAAMIAGGKDSWKSFTKSLTTTFKTAVVDQIYKAFAQPFVVNVVANMVGIAGLGGTQGAVAGAGNLLSLAGNAGSIYNVGSSVAGWLGLGGTAAATGLGLTAAAGAGTTLAATSAGLGLTGSALGAGYGLSAAGTGLGLSAGSAGASAIGAGIGTSAAAGGTAAAASTASSLMSTVATAMPYLAAATALVTIAKSFDDSGTLHMGAGAIYQKGRLREGRDIYGQELFNMGAPGEYNANAQANVSGIASAIGNALDTVATSFGKKAGYEIATAFADDSSGDGAWGALRISQGGQDLINWQDTRTSRWAPKEFADGEEGYKQYLAAVAKDTRQVLLDMDLPGWAKTVFNELGDSPSIETLAKSLEQVGRFNGILEAMGENVLPALADASDASITALVKAAGGTDALTASMVNYYNSTATDLDRQQYAFKSLNTALKEVGDLRPQDINLSDSLSGLFGGLGSNFATAIMGGFLAEAGQGALPELEQLTLPEGDVSLKEWYNGLVESASALDLNVQGNADYLAGLLALSPAVDSLAEAWDASLEGIFGSTTLGALANAALRGDAFATAVINAAGGLQAFGEAITGYYDNFYTEGEHAAMTTAQITKELAKVGVEMPKTREEFRALMDASVALGEAGQPVVSALLEVQGAFASVTEPVAEAAAAVEAVEQAYTRLTTVNRTAEDVANERISLEERLFNAAATAAQVAEKARNAIDAHNLALYDQVIAAENAKALLQTKKEVESEMLKADIRLAQAQGNRFEADRLQREAFIAGLGDLTEAQKEAKVAAYDYTKAIDAQVEAFGLLEDVNAKTKELQASDGPLDTIKTGIQAYITKFKELGQLTPAVEAALGNLQNLQLAQARDELYSRLLTPAEAAVKATDKLASSFTELGFEMPKSTQALRDLIDGVSNQETRDSLLQLVPTFVGLQDSSKDATSSVDNAAAALERLKYSSDGLVTSVADAPTAQQLQWAYPQYDYSRLVDPNNPQGASSVDQTLGQITSDLVAADQVITDLMKEVAQVLMPSDLVSEVYQTSAEMFTRFGGEAQQKYLDSLNEREAWAGQQDPTLIVNPITPMVQEAEAELDRLNSALQAWRLAQLRVLATKDLKAITQETQASKDKIAEMKQGAGIVTDIQALQQSYTDRLDVLDAGLFKEIALAIQGKQAEIATLETAKAGAIQNGFIDTSYYDKQIAAATADITALNNERTTFNDALTNWYSSKKEELATARIVEITNKIKEFDKTSGLGPIAAIKAGINQYTQDLKDLGQLTPDAQAAIDKLSELQLGQSRKNLYDQLLSAEEKSAREASDLGASFAGLGVQMPTTTAAFRALIDATTDPALKDSLLELVPTFVSVQGAAAQATETIEQAYNRLKNVTRTNEDIAREKISLEDRLFNATATTAQIAERARNAIDPLNRSLYDMVIAAESAKQALADAKTATDKALAAVDRAAAAQRTALQKQIADAKATEASLKGIFDALRNGARELRGEVSSTAAMQADQARALIRNAIATGVLPDQKALDEAISTSRAGLEAQVYATAQDAEFAKLVLAGELEKLQSIAEPKLSAAEQAVILAEEQLAALEDQVKQAKALVDGIRGVDGRVLTVGQAIEELQTAAAAETLAREQIDALQLQPTEAQKQYDELRGIKSGVDAIGPAITALAAAEQKAATGEVSGTGGDRVISRSIGAFASGGYYPGGLALVGEEGPELINFAQPGQVYTAPQTREMLGGMGTSERMASLMGEMAQEIRSLRAEVVQLRRSADKGNEHTAVIAQAHEGRGQAPLLVEIAQ